MENLPQVLGFMNGMIMVMLYWTYKIYGATVGNSSIQAIPVRSFSTKELAAEVMSNTHPHLWDLSIWPDSSYLIKDGNTFYISTLMPKGSRVAMPHDLIGEQKVKELNNV